MKNDLPNQLNEASLLSRLATYSSGIRLDDLPPVVLRQARLNVLDTIGCIVSGAALPETRQLIAAEVVRGGPAEATVLGAGLRLPVEAATRINAYMGDVFELNDLIGGHASIATVVPALALAESLGSTGAELVEAVVAGVEVVCRVHGGFYAHQKPFTEAAMVQVTIASASGAAAAAAKLMKLDATQTMHAMAIAASLTSWGPAELVFGEGNTLKPILFGGWPGAMGLVGANYAKHGITASSRLLESPIGYYTTVARSHDPHVVLDFDHWRLSQPRRKLHACCGYTHSAIDAVARLYREGAVQRAARVRVHLPAYIIPAISKGGSAPATPNEARFNIEYCLAQAATGADVILPEHSMACLEQLRRPEVVEALGKFEIVADPAYTHYRHARIELLDADGKVQGGVVNDAPRGSEWNPMTDDDVRAKFRRLTAGWTGGSGLDSYVERVERLETSPDTGWLLRSFG